MTTTSSPEKSEYGSAEEARAMLERAIAELNANQKEALAKFNDEKGPFRDRDLYVFCFHLPSGKMTAAYDHSLLGTDIRAPKDKDGSPLGLNIFNAATPGN